MAAGSVVIAPRVNRERFQDFIGQQIRTIGCVTSIDDQQRCLYLRMPNSSPDVRVTLHGPIPDVSVNRYVEVFGVVVSPTEINQVGPLVDLGNQLDMDLVTEAIHLTFHPQLKAYFQPCPHSLDAQEHTGAAF